MVPSQIGIILENITEDNKKDKFQKAIKETAKQLGIPATIEKFDHTNKEDYAYEAQQELYELNMLNIGNKMDVLYSRICSTLDMNPSNTFQKAIDPKAPTLGKQILWNPETGTPISQKDLDRLLNAVDKYMNRDPMAKEFVISQAAIARIIANLRKNYSYEELKNKGLNDLTYKKKKWDSFDNYKQLNDTFPANYSDLKFQERIVGGYIADMTDKTKSGVRDILNQGFKSRKPKSEISQDLFDKFGALNRNWDMIVEAESANTFNAQYIDQQREDVEPGEPLYFIRREFGDARTCSFCKQAVDNQIIAKWSDIPLQDENIKDPIASIAIWAGKSNYGRNRKDWWWAEGIQHPNCYSDDTEVLTDNGWKLFKEVLPLDKIMSINPDTREIDYLNHKGLISYHYDGEMVHFDGLNYDKLVTPGHNCLYKKHGKGKRLMQGKAEDLINTDFMVPRAVGEWFGFDYELERQAEIIGVDPLFYIKLWGWFLSEGNVRTYDRRHEIKLSQKNPQDIIDDLGERDFYKIAQDAIYIFRKDIVNLFKDFNGVHAEQKYIPDFIRNSSVKYIEAFLESFRLGDGSERISESSNPKFGKSREQIVRTSSPKMMSQLSELIVKAGKICSIKKQNGKGIAVEHENGIYVGNTDCYNISILKSKFRHYHKEPVLSKVTNTYSKEIHKVSYSGMVYDVELVKWHFLLVKRNGKLAWSGNCRGHWDRYYEEYGDMKL